ncbi:endonuclease VIII [Pelolinea submarina]|uniref:Formamidopyrimidine-DNA glycosylase n=1 Tax=Pelolinea submarina TaxID=913107 RepID=A0A347ZVP5_9CHLR|nr:endonuclease VIII [Pelolinea submarina]REG07072.1 formamidopyrimidine-DNA glycosylase [Pelolinea submarina]BBB49376.1 formamidopyrimidine-DNA glycosylase [Pelolinea submarina]
MIEIPEALALADQMNRTVQGKRIARVEVLRSPHKFAWFQGDPLAYPDLLTGQTVGPARGFGSTLEFAAGSARLAVSEGATWKYHADKGDVPAKHQLLLEFADGSALSLSVRMYGGILCFSAGGAENEYYLMAEKALPPLSAEFDWAHFEGLAAAVDPAKISLKAFLATEQRIPGLGNGCLQDILYNARLNPKRKLGQISADDLRHLYQVVKDTLADMTARGGRDTEPDLFGQPGGYQTRCSKNTVDTPCGNCGTPIVKQAYMGGSVYFCPTCQPLD